jgi:PAS domain-containing protein
VGVCPAHAKKIRDDLPRVQLFLEKNENIFCSLAPSYVSEFEGLDEALLIGLKRLGFAHISETAIGATLVSACVDKVARNTAGGTCNWISTACPSVVKMVKKYYPGLAGQLAPIPSPLQMHSAFLRKIYGKDIGIVFVGPCIAKKGEADEHPGYPDFALTFEELRRWLNQKGIDLPALQRLVDTGQAFVPPFEPAAAAETTSYPVEGGMLASLDWSSDPFQSKAVALSGAKQIVSALAGLQDKASSEFLELLACDGGCINGPGTREFHGVAEKKKITSHHTQQRLVRKNDLFKIPEDFIDYALEKGYGILEKAELPLASEKPFVRNAHSEEEILQALHALGKFNESDQLNCGGCGYNTCRDMACAYLDGMAEPEMCVTKMRKEAQNKIDVLLRTIPMGVVMVDDQLRIVDCNSGFLHLFGDIDYDIDGEIIDLIGGLPVERFVSFTDKFRQQFDTKRGHQFMLRHKDKFLRVTFFSVENHHLVGALFEDITSPTVRRETVVKKAEVVIQKSLETVQQIASLLGENAADTEITLNSLIEAFQVPDAEHEDGFTSDTLEDVP